jgi:hypothetical protein
LCSPADHPTGDAARPVPGFRVATGCRQRSPAGRRASSTARRGGFSVSQHVKVSVTCARPPPLPVMRQQPRRLRRRHPHLGCAAQAAAPPLRPQRVARDRGSTACGCLDPESLRALGRAPDGRANPACPARRAAHRVCPIAEPSRPRRTVNPSRQGSEAKPTLESRTQTLGVPEMTLAYAGPTGTRRPMCAL